MHILTSNKNNLFNELLRKNIVYLTSRQNKPKENEVKEENDFSKRIMETTIIKIGTECLTLKELGNKIKSTETPKKF